MNRKYSTFVRNSLQILGISGIESFHRMLTHPSKACRGFPLAIVSSQIQNCISLAFLAVISSGIYLRLFQLHVEHVEYRWDPCRCCSMHRRPTCTACRCRFCNVDVAGYIQTLNVCELMPTGSQHYLINTLFGPIIPLFKNKLC